MESQHFILCSDFPCIINHPLFWGRAIYINCSFINYLHPHHFSRITFKVILSRSVLWILFNPCLTIMLHYFPTSSATIFNFAFWNLMTALCLHFNWPIAPSTLYFIVQLFFSLSTNYSRILPAVLLRNIFYSPMCTHIAQNPIFKHQLNQTNLIQSYSFPWTLSGSLTRGFLPTFQNILTYHFSYKVAL